MRSWRTAVPVIVGLVLFGACGGGTSPQEASAPAPEPSEATDDFSAPPLEVPKKCARPSSEIGLETTGLRWVGPNGKAADIGELCISAPAGEEITLSVANPPGEGGSIRLTHNFSIYSDSLALDLIFRGPYVKPGTSKTFTVPALEPGTYLFRCDPHGGVMKGVLTIEG